jgi:hypothetical protein
MKIPPSRHFTTHPLDLHFNADRAQLGDGLAPDRLHWAFGDLSLHGIPFSTGRPGSPNVVLLEPGAAPVILNFASITATYMILLQAVEDRPSNLLRHFGTIGPAPGGQTYAGNELGDHVSDYAFHFTDGATHETPILRRFAIQQRHIDWGASPFEAIPARGPAVFNTAEEDRALGRLPPVSYGEGETRHDSNRGDDAGANLWLYALVNPHPERPITALQLTPKTERSLIYGITSTELIDHPLRPGVRQKLYLTLPPGVYLNAIGELDVDSGARAIGIDLGTVISARAVLDYSGDRWLGREPDVQPTVATGAVIVEYAAHPAGRLYVADGDGPTRSADLPNNPVEASEPATLALTPVVPALRPVTFRFLDAGTGGAVAVRLHIHGEAGEYLPPRGRHRKVNPGWFEDNYGEFVNDSNQYSYVLGDCIVDLPIGRVWIEITRGYEIAPIRSSLQIEPETMQFTFTLERKLTWRQRGWVTADTHVHFLSPQTALLEGAAEGVNVVNLLASQWGEMFSNVSDFDGRTTLGARDFGGDGEFLVRVGTENRMQVLGHISLLGYSGSMIHPLCTGGPSESAIGDPQEVSMAEWAAQCIDQGGLVVMPHAPNPQCERAADIVLDRIHAIEMMTFNPQHAQINQYGLADWYRYLNIGHLLPLVGGSDKMSAASLLGGVRTYAHLGEAEFTYESWMSAVKAGNTFVTVGPLVEFAVNGHPAGSRITLPTGGGTVDVTWEVASLRVPIDQVEVVVGGLVAEQMDTGGALSTAGSHSLTVTDSTWVALRVRGSLRGRAGDISAHTSAVQVLVGDRPIFAQPDAIAVLEQIEGALAYVDTLAPRPDAQRYKLMRASLEAAHNRLHTRLHQHDMLHRHTPTMAHDRS